MISSDTLVNLVIKMDAFKLKRGMDAGLRKEILEYIQEFTQSQALTNIAINDSDSAILPDVSVVPYYHKDYKCCLMDPDLSNDKCGEFCLELKSAGFDKFTSEEYVAIIVHNILQTTQSSMAKSRFMGAFAKASAEVGDQAMIEISESTRLDELVYLAYLDICLRPMEVLITNASHLGTDDIMRSIGLDDAYNSALIKMKGADVTTEDPEAVIARAQHQDKKLLRILFQSVQDKSLPGVYKAIRDRYPLMQIRSIIKVDGVGHVIGLAEMKCHRNLKPDEKKVAMVESFLNPKDEIELRYQVDKIITDMRFMEHEDERMAVLFHCRNLTVKVAKEKATIERALKRKPNDENLKQKHEYLTAIMAELETMRAEITKRDLHPHKLGVVVKYPVGYGY